MVMPDKEALMNAGHQKIFYKISMFLDEIEHSAEWLKVAARDTRCSRKSDTAHLKLPPVANIPMPPEAPA